MERESGCCSELGVDMELSSFGLCGRMPQVRHPTTQDYASRPNFPFVVRINAIAIIHISATVNWNGRSVLSESRFAQAFCEACRMVTINRLPLVLLKMYVYMNTIATVNA